MGNMVEPNKIRKIADEAEDLYNQLSSFSLNSPLNDPTAPIPPEFYSIKDTEQRKKFLRLMTESQKRAGRIRSKVNAVKEFPKQLKTHLGNLWGSYKHRADILNYRWNQANNIKDPEERARLAERKFEETAKDFDSSKGFLENTFNGARLYKDWFVQGANKADKNVFNRRILRYKDWGFTEEEARRLATEADKRERGLFYRVTAPFAFAGGAVNDTVGSLVIDPVSNLLKIPRLIRTGTLEAKTPGQQKVNAAIDMVSGLSQSQLDNGVLAAINKFGNKKVVDFLAKRGLNYITWMPEAGQLAGELAEWRNMGDYETNEQLKYIRDQNNQYRQAGELKPYHTLFGREHWTKYIATDFGGKAKDLPSMVGLIDNTVDRVGGTPADKLQAYRVLLIRAKNQLTPEAYSNFEKYVVDKAKPLEAEVVKAFEEPAKTDTASTVPAADTAVQEQPMSSTNPENTPTQQTTEQTVTEQEKPVQQPAVNNQQPTPNQPENQDTQTTDQNNGNSSTPATDKKEKNKWLSFYEFNYIDPMEWLTRAGTATAAAAIAYNYGSKKNRGLRAALAGAGGWVIGSYLNQLPEWWDSFVKATKS